MAEEKNNLEKLISDSVSLKLGLFAYTKEKVDKIVDDMVDRGEISKNEAKDKADVLLGKGKEEREELKKILKESFEEVIDPDDYVKKSDLADLIKEELEKIKDEADKKEADKDEEDKDDK